MTHSARRAKRERYQMFNAIENYLGDIVEVRVARQAVLVAELAMLDTTMSATPSCKPEDLDSLRHVVDDLRTRTRADRKKAIDNCVAVEMRFAQKDDQLAWLLAFDEMKDMVRSKRAHAAARRNRERARLEVLRKMNQQH
jgi:hypothetical protein